MRVCFVVLDFDHYKYFLSDRNEDESLLVLDKKFSVIREIAKRVSKGKEAPEWVFKATRWLMNKTIDLAHTDILVVTDLAQIKFPRGFVKWLKKTYPHMKTVMMFYNKAATMYGINGNVGIKDFANREIMLPFDKIYTYDPEEAEAFGFEYYTAISNVSRYLADVPNVPPSDVFFCGSVKHAWKGERAEVVDSVYQYLSSNHVNCDFHLVFSKSLPLPDRPYAGTKRLSYLETIKRSVSARVILEIVVDGQCGVTERFYNALMYNKKFISNNKAVLQHPCYDPRFMRVFEDPCEIDIAWLLDDEPVDYHYDGKYTPKGMFEMLKQL